MTDIWKAVRGFPGYFVSDLGNVMSCRSRAGYVHDKGALLKPDVDDIGRKRVTMAKDGRYLRRMVHHLVLEAFVGPMPTGHEADHRDLNPSNNSLGNLRWATRSQNNRNKPALGVTLERGRWRARIREASGRKIHLGLFDTKEEAVASYKKATVVHHGEFAHR